MKRIINLLLTFGVLWVATTYFSEYVSINSTRDLIIVTLLMFGLDTIYGLVVIGALFVVTLLSKKTLNFALIIIPYILLIGSIFIWTFMRLIIVDDIVAGFTINGNWLTYLLLVVTFSIFSIGTSNKSKQN